MAGRVPEHVVQQIARRADFVRLAGRYLDLTKRGKNYWALCPFHNEKTPSFSIDPDDGLYYCFGCKEGGNVFTFLQKMEGVSFGEALRQLAAEVGIDLSEYAGQGGPSADEMGRMRQALELATAFYQKCLQKARGSQAVRDYLAERQIEEESVARWRIGYAPDGWENLLKCATGRDFEPEELARAGLVRARDGAPGYYDRFRNRLIFPIADSAGRTVGFGARALSEDDEPKYLNSPETPLFSKGRCFFGLDQARASIRSGDRAVVLEGYTDVIMAHQAGVDECVGVLGTALTEDHARTLSRLCSNAVLLFDADEAGQLSAARSIELLLNEDMEVRVAQLPAGSDPCDYIVEHGAEALRQRLDESLGFFEFRLGRARQNHDTDTIEGRTAAFREVAELAAGLRDAARRDMVVRWVADELGISPRAVWQYLQRRERPGARGDAPDQAARATRLSATAALPGELLGLLLAHPALLEEARGRLEPALLGEGPERQVLTRLLEREAGETQDVSGFLGSLAEPELASTASRALAEERERERRISQATAAERLEGYLRYLERRKHDGVVPPPESLGDSELRDLHRRLKEKDKKSAQSR
ncbi:MAG: DNA primase [Candidatus Brocadiia bacterium]